MHADWLISGLAESHLARSRKSSCPLKKFILPNARSCKHFTNKILEEIKTYYAV